MPCPAQQKGPPGKAALSYEVYVRRCPTLPHRPRCSTIGAGRLNYRVRNETGCFPTAITTETPKRTQPRTETPGPCPNGLVGWFPVMSREPHSEREQQAYVFKPLGLLVPVNSTPYDASISGLSTQSSSWGPYNPKVGRPHLKEGFPLRCFQRLSRPDVANQPCTWRYNWHTRGPSVPVLSY